LQWRILHGAGGWHWPAYVLVTSLALYSHLFATFVLLAEDVLFLIVILRGRFKPVAGWIASQTAIVLAYIPWLAIDSAALPRNGQRHRSAGTCLDAPGTCRSLRTGRTVSRGAARLLRQAGIRQQPGHSRPVDVRRRVCAVGCGSCREPAAVGPDVHVLRAEP